MQRHVAQLVEVGVERAGCHFVQQWLPDMRQIPFHQQYVVLPATVFRTQSRDQFESSGAPSDHDDLGSDHRALARLCMRRLW